MNILEQLFDLLLSNQDSIDFHYINDNGKETVIVNGEEITYDDSRIKESISRYKTNVESLDDCDFLDIIESVAGKIDPNTFDELVNKEHFTKEEATTLNAMLNIINDTMQNYLELKIDRLTNILDNIVYTVG